MTRLNRVGNWESGIVRDLGVRERNPSDIHFEVMWLARPGSSGNKKTQEGGTFPGFESLNPLDHLMLR
jgi:hypothetical protein